MGTHSGCQSWTSPFLLMLIIISSLWTIHAELTFLGQEPNRAFIPQTIQERGIVYQFFVVDTTSYEMPAGVTFTSSLNNLFPFLLDPLTGELVMNGLITEDEYFIVVQATSPNSFITIVTNITIFVVPISDTDTSPRFEHELYEIEMSENLPQSSPIIAIRAFSLTLNPTGTQQYSIVAGNTDSDFSINIGNGLLRVNEILDRERTSAYQLTIRYVDDLSFVDTSVAISILDVNDQAPQFSRSLYDVTVPETLSPGTIVLTVEATDGDVGINAMVMYSFDATASETFSLNQTDGVLRTISELDYERQPRYQFSITVEDGGSPQLTSVTTVLVNLQNIDDECPRFENAVFIEELPYDITGTPPEVGTEILTVMATDPDRFSDVTYSIVSGSTPVLALDSQTGVITLASIEDDPRGQYTLNVSASDQTCINESFVRVEVGIGNVNDHSPQFQSDCTVTIEENPPIGKIVTTLLATDDDIGFNSLITYSLLSGTELFEIDASGVVRTIAPPDSFDREVQSTLLAGVTATDGGGRQDYCLLTVTLSDQNDNAPSIPLSSYSTSLARDSGIGAFVLQITADDPDIGNNGSIEYSIDSEMMSLPFEINSISGVITTSGTFSNTDPFTFNVVAADMGPEQLTSVAMITITLTDGNALPIFSAANYTGEICENSPFRTVVLIVNATSPDNFISFRILTGSDYRSNFEETFDLRTNHATPNLASITVGTETIVNFERLSPHNSFQFFVEASTGAGRSIVPIEIFVNDVDDNDPEFPTQAMSIVIAENEPIGTTVAQLQAVDPDSGTNGEIQYRFAPGLSSPYFAVAIDGFITSLEVFDFETALETRGNLLVEAYNPNPIPTDPVCSSSPSERTSTVTRIEWSIRDQNDNPPVFEANEFRASIREDTPIQNRILELNATDMDISDLGRLTFSIHSGNDGTFGIESQYIILTRRLDFETAENYELVVHVTDGIHSVQDCPESGCVATVTISVIDVDDEAPVFSQLTYSTAVVENAPVGTEVVNISATDIDSPSIEYRLTGLAEGRFQINEMGVITVAGEIDREAFPGGGLVFLAFAEGGSLAIADIEIDIQDVNDYEPRFSGVFTGEVVENTPPDESGIRVTQVRAVDLDAGENGTVFYSLVGEKHGFEIDPETGDITAHAMYDREATPAFVLTVEATDNGTSVQLSSQTEVVITIGDVNDNSARFQFPYMFARVFENAQIGQSVIFLPVVDPDTDINAEVIFTLLATNPQEQKFALNSTTGEITITGNLDYEIPLHRLYTLTVSVEDPVNPPSSEGTVQIELLDRNDNEPIIDITHETNLLQETFPTGVQVAVITGSDLDSGINAELTFEITSGNTNNDFVLSMDGERAVIKSSHQLDYETTFSYALTITASDMGSPPLSATVICEFTIIDVNDEPPVFTESEYKVSVIENFPPSASLLQIEAIDSDTGNGGQIARYELVSGNEGGWFALNNTSGVLSSLVEFDREEMAEYVLTVAAYDNGAVPVQGLARIVVTIEDVNDNPSFNGGHLNVLISALNGQVDTGNIAPLNFNDPDTDDMFTGCEIIRQDHTDVFNVIRSNCVIELLINEPPEDDYNYVEVRGRDGINTDVDVTATIRVVHFAYNGPTSPIAQNLVTLTLNASSEQYIKEQLNITFPAQISRALGVVDRNIEIVTVQQGVLAPASTVEISFVARESADDFITPAAIIHQLYVQRDSLAINGHKILSLPLDLCASEPCQNQAGCRTIQNVRSTGKVISTREFVYFAPRIEFSYECVCVPGTTGQHCETNFDDCYSNPCQQGAACTDLVNGFSCDCPNGYTGVDCSIAPDACSTNVCSNEAACIIVNDDIHCDCNAGYYGPRCEYQYFIPSNLCQQTDPCQNGGECSAGRDSISCICRPGFSGQFCEIETQLQGGCIGNPCYNGSTCEETSRGPNCTCSIGFTGPSCRWPLNNCELEPCLNGGTCATGFYGTYVCNCRPGYTGDDCGMLISPCVSSPCLNNGRCTANNDDFSCECISGYYGSLCEFTVHPVDFCFMMDCSENGNCTSGRDTFTCSCEDGFSGDDCSIISDGVCTGNPCQHGSTCIELESGEGFACSCSPGFTGTYCEIDVNECMNNPCVNEGTCVDGISGYSCTCPSGLAGYNCEIQCPQSLTGVLCQTPINSCSDIYCENNGTCIQDGGTINCVCPPTYTGSRCEIEVVCTESSCLNGGSCIQLSAGGIECACGEEFMGDNCELLTVSFSGSTSQSSYRAFRSLDIRGQGRIEFEFATADRDGLLLYNTQLQNGQTEDYIAVEIVSGALQVSVSHGNGDSSVTFTSSPQGVADGNWHQVVIETNQKEFHVLLDNCLLLPTTLLPFATTCSLMNITPGTQGFLDLGLPLWVGGTPPGASSTGHFASQGVTGCIRGVRIDGTLLDLEGYVFEANSARGCSHLESAVCAGESLSSVCGGGACLSVFDGYSCDCPVRREGTECESAAQSNVYGGGSFARYSILEYQPLSIAKRQVSTVSIRSTISDEVSLWFRTEMESGVALLLYMGSADTGDEFYIQIEDGNLALNINLGSLQETFLLTNKTITDSAWHFVAVKRSALELTATIDDVVLHHTLIGTQLSLDVRPIVYTGGRPNPEGSDIISPYLGCLQDIRIDRNPLPTSGSNNFASVVFVGEEVSNNCALGLCLPNPCRGGNCSEVTLTRGSSFECACEGGLVVTGSGCPGESTPPMFTLIVVFATVAGGLLICVTIVSMGIVCYQYRRRLAIRMKYEVSDRADISLAILNRQALGVSNETGGGERDTHIGIDEISNTLFTNKHAIEDDEKEQSGTQSSTDTSISKPSFSMLQRTASPTIGEFIREKIEGIPKEYRDFDSLYEYEEEGNGSITGSLSTICSSIAESEYTIEKLRAAGPELEPFIDLLADVLESEEEEELDGGSQQAHTGNTQLTQGTPYSQELW